MKEVNNKNTIITDVNNEEEREKGRDEEKVVGFSSAFIFPVRKWEAVTQSGTI